jgi:hypothetical protein
MLGGVMPQQDVRQGRPTRAIALCGWQELTKEGESTSITNSNRNKERKDEFDGQARRSALCLPDKQHNVTKPLHSHTIRHESEGAMHRRRVPSTTNQGNLLVRRRTAMGVCLRRNGVRQSESCFTGCDMIGGKIPGSVHDWIREFPKRISTILLCGFDDLWRRYL